jgi:hypothetical protein
MTIKFRKYIVEFDLRTEDDDPDQLFNEYLDGVEITSSDSPERIKVVFIQPKINPHIQYKK